MTIICLDTHSDLCDLDDWVDSANVNTFLRYGEPLYVFGARYGPESSENPSTPDEYKTYREHLFQRMPEKINEILANTHDEIKLHIDLDCLEPGSLPLTRRAKYNKFSLRRALTWFRNEETAIVCGTRGYFSFEWIRKIIDQIQDTGRDLKELGLFEYMPCWDKNNSNAKIIRKIFGYMDELRGSIIITVGRNKKEHDFRGLVGQIACPTYNIYTKTRTLEKYRAMKIASSIEEISKGRMRYLVGPSHAVAALSSSTKLYEISNIIGINMFF